MSNREHVDVLLQGAEAWNNWRRTRPGLFPDFQNEDFAEKELDLTGAQLHLANFAGATLRKAVFVGAELERANFSLAVLPEADFSGARLYDANFKETKLNGATFVGANLSFARFLRTNLDQANLSDCTVYGTTAWGVSMDGATQSNLKITGYDEPVITADNLEMAQFIYLLLNTNNLHLALDAITSKNVLILGRFTPERKAVLNAVRERLRQSDFVPLLFDFDIPTRLDMTETVTLLSRMSSFIIADLTDPSSVPKELEAIVPTLAIPVQPLLQGTDETERPYSMFGDYWKYDWVLEVQRYDSIGDLLATFEQKVLTPVKNKLAELLKKRNG